jgi:hypothetical protein
VLSIASASKAHLEEARTLCARVPAAARPLFLPSLAADAYLKVRVILREGCYKAARAESCGRVGPGWVDGDAAPCPPSLAYPVCLPRLPTYLPALPAPACSPRRRSRRPTLTRLTRACPREACRRCGTCCRSSGISRRARTSDRDLLVVSRWGNPLEMIVCRMAYGV